MEICRSTLLIYADYCYFFSFMDEVLSEETVKKDN